jgi:hypothetical protein
MAALVALMMTIVVVGGCGGGSPTSAVGGNGACGGYSNEAHEACAFGRDQAKAGESVSDACQDYVDAAATACITGYEHIAEEGNFGITKPAVAKEEEPLSGHKEELTAEEAEAAEAAGAEAADVDYDETITYNLVSEQGFHGQIVFERAPVEEAEPAVRTNGTLSEGASCAIDQETDAVEPIHVDVRNTTHKFSASPGVAIMTKTPHGELPNAEVELGYSEGPECVELIGAASQYEAAEGYGGVANLTPTEPLSPGGSISADGFLIFKHYYSPAHPQGQPDQYVNSILLVEPVDNEEHFGIGNAEGVLVPKGNQIVQNSAVHNALPLLPGLSGGCLVQPPCEAAFKTE